MQQVNNDGYSSDSDEWTPEPVSTLQFIDQTQWKYIDRLISEWVILNNHEFSITEEPEFKKLMKYILPAYETCGREMIRGRLMNELKERTENKVHKVKYILC